MELKNEGVVLQKTEHAFENQGVFNPGCILGDNGVVHMFYRAVREGNFSTIGYCQLAENKVLKRATKPLLVPEYDFERQGLEDPRVVKIEDIYYLFYTAFDGRNAMVAYATSSDLKFFKKHGVISPKINYDDAIGIFKKQSLKDGYQECKGLCEAIGGKNISLWDKDASMFPRKIGGRYALIHRILPDIHIAYFEEFAELTDAYWEDYLRHLKDHTLLEPRYEFESRNIGPGCPPVETPQGWLLIYHGVQETVAGAVYHAAAALLDLKDPRKVIGRLSRPLFSPTEPWEKVGSVNNIVFPTGAVVIGDRLWIYYGAADQSIGAKSLKLEDLITALIHSKS